MNKSLFSSKTDEWPTPDYLFKALDREFKFSVDVCATHLNTKSKRYYTKAEDGLSKDWSGETVWLNPPYGRQIKFWMEKAFLSSTQGATVVCLVPARCDAAWWHRWCMKASEIRYLQGRITFVGAKSAAPFPSAIVIFRPAKPSFSSAVIPKPSSHPVLL